MAISAKQNAITCQRNGWSNYEGAMYHRDRFLKTGARGHMDAYTELMSKAKAAYRAARCLMQNESLADDSNQIFS